MSRAEPETPLVSIGVPTYNRPEGLRRALTCIAGQTYSNLEIIVSDNASPGPETEAIAREFAARDPRVRYVRQPRNVGAAGNFQAVLDSARGEYFTWFADDDAADERFIAALVPYLRDDAKVVLAMSDVYMERPDGSRVLALESIRAGREWPSVRDLFFVYPTSNVYICIYGLYRTSVLRGCHLHFDSWWKNISFASEVPFLAQLAARGRIVSHPEALKTYVNHADSTYMRERARISRFDRRIRHLEVRTQVSRAALRSGLPLAERMRLGIMPWRSLFRA